MRFSKGISGNFKYLWKWKHAFIQNAANIMKANQQLKLNFEDSRVSSRNMQIGTCFVRKFVVSLVPNLLKEYLCACLQSFCFFSPCGNNASLKYPGILLGSKWVKGTLVTDNKCNCNLTSVWDVMQSVLESNLNPQSEALFKNSPFKTTMSWGATSSVCRYLIEILWPMSRSSTHVLAPVSTYETLVCVWED